MLSTAKNHLDLGGSSGSFFSYFTIGTLNFSALKVEVSVWMFLGLIRPVEGMGPRIKRGNAKRSVEMM